MAVVKRFGAADQAAFASFVAENSPSWVTRNGNNIYIDDGFIKILHGWTYGVTIETTRNDTRMTYSTFDYSNVIVTVCYNDHLFWLQASNNAGKRVCVVYEKFDSGLVISGALGTSGAQGTMDFQPINNFSLLDLTTSQAYTHRAILNYNVPLGHIDYGPDSLFTGTVITNIVDPNFITCSTITQDRVITFNGANYYSVGPHTIIPIDPEE